VDHRVKRRTSRWTEPGASGVCHGDEARLIDLCIRDTQDLRGLFLEQQVQGGPGRPQSTSTGREHEAPPRLGNRSPHGRLYDDWLAFAATIGEAYTRDHEDGRLVHVIREVLGRGHDARLLGVALGVVKGEVSGSNGERHIDGPALSVHISERLPFGRIGHHNKVPVLEIRPRWGLLGNREAFLQS
jgi:hypothetical protein